MPTTVTACANPAIRPGALATLRHRASRLLEVYEPHGAVSGRSLAALAAATLVWSATLSGATVATPTVTGPWPSTVPGAPDRNYPFAAAATDLAASGWVEQEFFIEGSASRYETSPLATATVVDGGHPYKTRIVVRRPAAAARFNGTVIIEWNNVSSGQDGDLDWAQTREHLMRSGYAWVGVSAQAAGVAGLKAWNAKRYGTLDVTHGGVVPRDDLAFDIFAQAGQAVRNAEPVMGGLRVERLFATGHSQSAGRLALYVNSIHPLGKVFEAVILRGGGGRVRSDLDIPVWKLLAETDVQFQAINRQPDTPKFRTWEVAGTSHADFRMIAYVNQLVAREGGPPLPGGCERPPFSRIPFHYVFHAAIDHLVRWVRDGTVPPTAPPIQVSTVGPPAVIVRDAAGNAVGGIRLPQHEVAIAVNTGVNAGPVICGLSGSYEPFDAATLAKLYPTHQRYVSRVKEVAERNQKAGYLLKADADATIAEAETSAIGK